MAHEMAGMQWSGDQDAILRGLRIGTLKSRPARLPRNRVDGGLAARLSRRAVRWTNVVGIHFSSSLQFPVADAIGII